MVISFDHFSRIIGFAHPQLYTGREDLGTPVKSDQEIFIPAFHPQSNRKGIRNYQRTDIQLNAGATGLKTKFLLCGMIIGPFTLIE